MTCQPAPPSDPEAIRQQIARFNESEFARLLDLEILEAAEGYAKVIMDPAGKKNPGGVLHGGAIFALADQAFGIAANCCGIHRVAVSVSIQYIAPAGGRLVAVAERVDDNGSCDTYRVLVHEGERPVAEFTGVAFRV
jgi:acyl-CoA thioesterase